MDKDECYRFTVEWFDSTVKVTRKFLLSYFRSDNSVEMYDCQFKRLFLKRLRYEDVNVSDFYIGNVVNILSRPLLITGYGDLRTEKKFTEDSETTLAVINHDAFSSLGKIMDIIQQNDLTISKGYMAKCCSKFINCSFADKLSDVIVVLELRGLSAIGVWDKLVGNETTCTKPLICDLGLLAQYCISSGVQLTKDFDIFFPKNKEYHCDTTISENTTCCIIKPHAVKEGVSGKIIQDILDSGFIITAFEYFHFDIGTAMEFYEVYKGVVPHYQEMVSQLMSGTCIGLEIYKNSKTVEEFREFVGPMDTRIAVKLRPGTLRARYGQDEVKNAIHCTDLSEDSKLEVEYLFRILSA